MKDKHAHQNIEAQAKHAMERITDNVTFFAFIPWNGVPIPCELYMLNSVQIKACGDFDVIHLESNEQSDKEYDLDSMIRIKNTQEKILQYALIHPSFDEIVEYLDQTEVFQRIKSEIKRIEGLLESLDKRSKEYKDLSNELEIAKISIGFMLPDDFMAGITSLILQRDNTDIRKVSRDILLEAALLAEKWNNRPSDHISGVFTDFQKQNINKSAAIVLQEFRKDQEMAKGTGSKWLRGGKVNMR